MTDNTLQAAFDAAAADIAAKRAAQATEAHRAAEAATQRRAAAISALGDMFDQLDTTHQLEPTTED